MKRTRQTIISASLALILVATPSLIASSRVGADTSTSTELMSIANDGSTSDNSSNSSVISPDGRYVYFISTADNLVSGDTNNASDIFVRDRLTNTTSMLDVNSSGVEGNASVTGFDVSDGGRYLVFTSNASNLGPDQTPGGLFLKDLRNSTLTRLMTPNAYGETQNYPVISGDGNWIAFTYRMRGSGTPYTDSYPNAYIINRKNPTALTKITNTIDSAPLNATVSRLDINYDGSVVAFGSTATNLVSNDTNGVMDVFVWKKDTGSISRVNVSSSGTQATVASDRFSISGDGNKIVFTSGNNLGNVPLSHNNTYLRQLDTSTTSVVSTDSSGQEGDKSVYSSVHISEDGNYVAFESPATNLVSNDTDNMADIFVKDLESGSTTLESIGPDGNLFGWGHGESGDAYISADGQFVTFNQQYTSSAIVVYLRY